MLEIRLININELQSVVNLANQVYEQCVKGYVNDEDMVRQYYDYVQPQALSWQMREGRLFIWGAYENGALCAVGAMQHTGHITMFYVHPYFQRRGIGSLMLNQMLMFADKERGLERVTVNVIPVTASGYFYRRGFLPVAGHVAGQPFASLVYSSFPKKQSSKSDDRITYPARKVRTRTVLLLTAIVLLLSFGIGSGVTIRYWVQEASQTQTDNR